VSYFFCQATDSRINIATAVLRELLFLLVSQQPTLVSHVRKAGKGTSNGCRFKYNLLERSFQHILRPWVLGLLLTFRIMHYTVRNEREISRVKTKYINGAIITNRLARVLPPAEDGLPGSPPGVVAVGPAVEAAVLEGGGAETLY